MYCRKWNPHRLTLRVWMPALMTAELPHLIPKPRLALEKVGRRVDVYASLCV